MEGKENLIEVSIEDEMKSSYMDYAMSVIIGRALPDARDGLKPVHRRILYAMHSEGLVAGRKFSKCAGVVGEVLKKFHPHGDSAVYDSLVRMAQPWNLRYTLIDGQGNFGSVDGDPAAAYRYTECRMKSISEELLKDIDKDTVNFVPNFDESTGEPSVLPSRLPNLLINGAEGIAVGMASKIPPHNLREVVEATIMQIENKDVTIEDLLKVLPGPDLPTGGIIRGGSCFKSIYTTGRGIFKIRGKVRVETKKDKEKERELIVIDEIPYQVNKARFVEQIADLVRDKKIEGVSKLRDESDRNGMRIVIETKKDAVSEVIINQLYKYSQLEKSFGVILLAIVKNKPLVMNLKQVLQVFIDHRRVVIVRRTEFELNKAKARQHILEGLKIALTNIEEIIKIIRSSETTEVATQELIARFALSSVQTKHILDMPLKRLTALEQKAIESEYESLCIEINRLLEILSSSEEVDAIIVSELKEVAEKYGDKRKSDIEYSSEDFEDEDLIAKEEMVVSITHRGYAKRCSTSLFRAQKRGGKGKFGVDNNIENDGDFVTDLFVASTHDNLMVFTSSGKVFTVKVYKLPESGRTSKGRALINILKLESDEKITAVLPVEKFEADKFVIMVTKKGYIKRTNLMEFSNIRVSGLKASNLDPDDSLVSAAITDGKNDCIISSSTGMAIRFRESSIRVMGRTARGVRSIRQKKGAEVVSFVVIESGESIGLDEDPSLDLELEEVDIPEDIEQEEIEDSQEDTNEDLDNIAEEDVELGSDQKTLLTICENGFGKRTSLVRYKTQGRGGSGVKDIKTSDRNGQVVGTLVVSQDEHVMLITNKGKLIRIKVSDISLVNRNTQGVSLISTLPGEKVAAITKLAEGEEDSEIPEIEENNT